MELDDYLDEFVIDWELAGKAANTAAIYGGQLRLLAEFAGGDEVSLRLVKRWLHDAESDQVARMRGRSVRAFGAWAQEHDGPDWSWWPQVPLRVVQVRPQPTVDEGEYRSSLRKAGSVRDRLVIELLWSSGLRVSEIAQVQRDDVSLSERSVLVRKSKTRRPRLAPISDRACRLIRRLPERADGSLLGMTSGAIQQLLKRLGAPSAHAWRRGWAVRSLRDGVSETSVRAAGGWSSGAMVARYTNALSGELAIAEFDRVGKTAPTTTLGEGTLPL